MTAGDYLDGLPSVETFEATRHGRWVAFPEGHAKYGHAFYLADPYWWDGVYPNAIRMIWGLQGDDSLEWSVTFWTSHEATSGAFFRIKTRPDWTIAVPSIVPPTSSSLLATDGKTRLQAGVISNGTETIAIERYFDTIPASGGNSTTAGSAMFAIFRTTAGYVASISGPTVWSAFSFSCDAVFSALPKLLTKDWPVQSADNRPVDSGLLPTSVRRDLGSFTLVPESGSVYDLSASAFVQKPHGPERSEVNVRHLSLNASGPASLSQKEETEIVSVGAYGTAGNRFIPYAKAGSDPTTATITVSRTGNPSYYALDSAGVLYAAVFEAIPQRTATVTLAGLQGFGTRFIWLPQNAATGSAQLADEPVPLFTNALGIGGAFTAPSLFWNEYPEFSEILASQQTRLNNYAATRNPPQTGSEYYGSLVAGYQAKVAEQDALYAEWMDPASTKTRGDFFPSQSWDGSTSVFFMVGTSLFRTSQQKTNRVLSCGDQASAYVGFPFGFQTTSITSSQQSIADNSTAEQIRSASFSTHLLTRPTSDGVAAVRHLGPHGYSYNRKSFFEPLELATTQQTVPIVPSVGGFAALQTQSGQTLFEHKYVRAQPGTNLAGVEKVNLIVTVNEVLADSLVWSLPSISPDNISLLLSNGQVTYQGTATVSANASTIADFPASVTITLT